MSTLPTARVGYTALRVPVIGLGTAPLGYAWSDVSESQAIETVHYALDHGVTFLDTAPWYDACLIEERLGRALAGVPRDSYVLATKVGRLFTPDKHPVLDFSRAGVQRSIEGSLERLQVDQVDILHIHAPETPEQYRQAVEEAYPLLADMRRQGMIRAVGVGENHWQPLVEFARDGHFDCFLLAGRYTLLEQGALHALDEFYGQAISVFGAGVYNTGILAHGTAKDVVWYQYKQATSEIITRTRRIEMACERHGVPLRAAAVQFVKAHPAITALVIGAESAQQLEESIEALHTPIPDAFWYELRSAGLVDGHAPLPVQPAS
ncbi:MAG: aldo/keto reductase [Anaerolineae bacterium]|nr:aldo/keto reductase [Anaerolineae bacterium]